MADATASADGAILLSQIEDASLNASAPIEQLWIDGWLVRLGPGKARRSRCIHALAPSRIPLSSRLQECMVLYAAAALPMVFRITPYTLPPALDADLAALGYASVGATAVMVCRRLPTLLAAKPPLGLELLSTTPAAFADAVGLLRGSSSHDVSGHARRLTLLPVTMQGWVLREPGNGVIAAAAQATQEGRRVGLYDVHTAEHARHRGLATWLCQHLLSKAASNGATVAYLQVEADNHVARRLYRRLGFEDGYRYHYRQAG